MGVREALGGLVENVATKLNMPERGWSEGIAGGNTPLTGYDASIQGPSYLAPVTSTQYYSAPYTTPAYKQTVAGMGNKGVLGEKTPSGGTSTYKPTPTQQTPQGDGFSMAYYPGWTDEAAARADWKATGGAKGKQGVPGTDGGDQISDMYEPYRKELEAIASGISQRGLEGLENVETDYSSGLTGLTSEESDLQKSLDLQGKKMDEGAQSGYSEAIRNYNALTQQGLNRYGGGSSTGSAIGELIGQQFLRGTGQARQALQSGKEQLGLETQKLKTYISGKKDALDKWRRDARTAINENLQNKLAEIGMKRGELESNKMAARQDALKQAIEDAKAVQREDTNFKQQMAAFAVDSMQKAQNRAFTPQEIAAVTNDIMGQNFGSMTGQNAGLSYAYPQQKQPRSQEDILKAAGLV